MKTAFKILPQTNDQSLQLLVEVGEEGIAFVYYQEAPLQMDGLFIYQFDQPSFSASYADDLKIFLLQESLPSFHRCNICFNFNETSLVPNRYFNDADKADVLNVLYGENPSTECFVQDVKGMQAKLLYRIPQNIVAALKHTFPNAQYHHSTALQLAFLQKEEVLLYAIVYQQHVKMFLFNNNQIQIQQSFHYDTPADVAYYLLNICQQHEVAPSSASLLLAGFVDQQSNLYDELYKYFLHIRFDDEYIDATVAESIQQYPAHFFSHYFQLIPCVS